MIPPAVDELMWLLAEQREPSAVESFLVRYPDLRPELLRRMRLVQEMKGLKAEIPVPSSLPAFQPTASAPQRASRWWVAPVAAFGLLTAGYASFLVTRASVATSTPMPAQVQPAPPVTQTVPHPANVAPVPATQPHTSPVQTPQESTPLILGPGDVAPIVKPNYSDRLLKPVEVTAENLASQTVVNNILGQVGLRPVFGPGMTNELVNLEAHGVPASDALKELGEKAGFTFFDQQDGSVLILPAVDQKPKAEGN